MLILKAYINERLIDVVCIVNKGQCPYGKLHRYEIVKPLVKRPQVKHLRKDGWMPLAAKVLTRILGEKSK